MLRYSIRWAGTADNRWVRFPNCQAGRGTWLTIDLRQIDFCWISLFHIWTVCIVLLVSHTNPDVCEEPQAAQMQWAKYAREKVRDSFLEPRAFKECLAYTEESTEPRPLHRESICGLKRDSWRCHPKSFWSCSWPNLKQGEGGGDCPIDLDPGCWWGRSCQQFWLHFFLMPTSYFRSFSWQS